MYEWSLNVLRLLPLSQFVEGLLRHTLGRLFDGTHEEFLRAWIIGDAPVFFITKIHFSKLLSDNIYALLDGCLADAFDFRATVSFSHLC